jgi:fucose 4-O-acetylase-like acetyltransferase
MNSRNVWVDYTKAIGIILVVYGHVIRGLLKGDVIQANVETHMLVDSIIYSFHMPLFFFLSGLFFFKSLTSRGQKGVFFNKLDTVVYPFLVWSILQGVIEALLSRYTNGDVSLGKVFSLLWEPRAQFWFLYALFLVFAVSIVLYGSKSKKVFLPIFLLSGIAYGFQSYAPDQMHLDFLIQNFVFFAFGVWFNNIAAAIEAQPGRIAAFTLLVTLGLEYQFHFISHHTYTDRGWMSLMVALSAILFVTSLSMVLARKPIQWLITIGSLSMPIYLMHILAGSGTRVILSKFLHIDNPYIHIFAACFIGIVAPIIAAKIMMKLHMDYMFQTPKLTFLKKHPKQPGNDSPSVAS